MKDSLRKFKAAFFQALAHPTRIAIIELLRDGEVSVGQLCGQLHPLCRLHHANRPNGQPGRHPANVRLSVF